jgi:GTP-dependent phosphoenolpyruvate carboxykinase
MNTQTVTIQEFQQMMKSADSKLPEFLQKIVEVAKPEDVRVMTNKSAETMWGWPRL